MEDIIENSINESNEMIEENHSVLTQEEEELLNQVIEEEHPEIPVNSKSILIDETTARFSSAPWYERVKELNVLIAGLGGIGSWAAMLIARVKPNMIYLFDSDIVETVNMSGQLYSTDDLCKKKVDCMCDIMSKYCNYNNVLSYDTRFTDDNEAVDIMICGFDNMEARKTFFKKWSDHVSSKPEEKRVNCLFIDGRLAAEEFQILCIRGDDEYNKKRYSEEFLFSDEEADSTICSYKQTSFMANMIASIMVNLFINFVTNLCNPLIERDLPFFTTYNAENMYFKAEI